MNDIRKILIFNGWEPDQNNALAEVVIPSTIETLNAPRKVTFLGQTLNWIPSTAAALQELELVNATSISTLNQFKTYSNLSTIKLDKVVLIEQNSYKQTANVSNYGAFNNITALTTLIAPELTTITENVSSSSGTTQKSGAFYNSGIVTLYLPKLQAINTTGEYYYNSYIGAFNSCGALVTVNLPSLQKLGNTVTNTNYATLCGTFANCTSLQDVTLGSDGHPVNSIESIAFNGCTQTNLTITVYTNGGAALSGAPWGATNATIEYEEA